VPDDDDTPDDDKFRPEAIAARVDRLGDETDADRVAREEEQKLLVRRKEQKSALETAASRRLNRIGEEKVKRPASVKAAAPSDAAGDISARLSQWVQQNGTAFGAVLAVVSVCVVGALGWNYRQDKRNADASVLLAQAFADDHGHLTTKDKDDEDDPNARPQLYPAFKTATERRQAALTKYRSVESKYPGTGAAIVARLGEGSLLLDAGDAQNAKAAYTDVKGSPLALADVQVRGRSLEGIGFADELLAQTDEANKDKHFADALGAFQDLAAIDADGFKELGTYHQARVFIARGDKAKATEILKDLTKRVSGAAERRPSSYLQFVVEDRLRELDPMAVPPKPVRTPKMSGAGGAGANIDMSDPKIQELLRQIQQGGATPPSGSK